MDDKILWAARLMEPLQAATLLDAHPVDIPQCCHHLMFKTFRSNDKALADVLYPTFVSSDQPDATLPTFGRGTKSNSVSVQ
ncbi:hypothetical protein [uncultured Roseobacter sp.]|uniref:hypothetical protein n=1 Tax=uncultured Roseobacter sp. TaxID=114847 RepID=UPI00261DA888|nr:hypothetical protein [uncultured Roseobacter sp.]